MKRGTPLNPKVAHLAELLKLELFEAVGILEMIWHFTAQYAPQGDIGKWPDEAIAKAVGWKRPTGRSGVTPGCTLSDALVEAKWLDRDPQHRLIVHDWQEHCDQSVTRKLARQKLAFVQPKLAVPKPVPKPEPEPEPHAEQPPHVPAAPAAIPIRQAHPPGYDLDELWAAFREAAAWAGWIDGDYREAWPEWCVLDSEQRMAAIAGIDAQAVWRPPRYMPGPRKWLAKREWQRRAPPEEPKSGVAAMLEAL